MIVKICFYYQVYLMLGPNCDFLWKVAVALFKYMFLLLSRRSLADYLKECRKCTLLRFSFSGLWDAMWENSRKMSRYVASPGCPNGPSDSRISSFILARRSSVTMSALACCTAILKGSWPSSSSSFCVAPRFRNKHTCPVCPRYVA